MKARWMLWVLLCCLGWSAPCAWAQGLACGGYLGAQSYADMDRAIRFVNASHGAMARLVAYKKSVAELSINYARASKCGDSSAASNFRRELERVSWVWDRWERWALHEDANELKHMHTRWWRHLRCNHDVPRELENLFNRGVNVLRRKVSDIKVMMAQLVDTDDVSYAHERAQLILASDDVSKTINYIQLRVNEHLNRVRYAAELGYFKFLAGHYRSDLRGEPCDWWR